MNHLGDLPVKDSAYSEEQIAAANIEHDRRMSSTTRITGYAIGAPGLDKSLPSEELDRAVWKWHTTSTSPE